MLTLLKIQLSVSTGGTSGTLFLLEWFNGLQKQVIVVQEQQKTNGCCAYFGKFAAYAQRPVKLLDQKIELSFWAVGNYLRDY